MPNHIQNILTIVGSDELVKKVNDFIRGTEPFDGEIQPIDFNKILPMPDDLDIESGSTGETAMKYLQNYRAKDKCDDFEKVRKIIEDDMDEEERRVALDLGRKYIHNLLHYGAKNWYDWCRFNWGTKWNAYWGSVSNDGRKIWFSTAWSAPIPVIEALAKRFPEAAFELTFADEDAGYNAGCVQFEDGCEVYFDYPIGDSDEAWAYYFKTHPCSEDYYKKVDGKWKYVED